MPARSQLGQLGTRHPRRAQQYPVAAAHQILDQVVLERPDSRPTPSPSSGARAPGPPRRPPSGPRESRGSPDPEPVRRSSPTRREPAPARPRSAGTRAPRTASCTFSTSDDSTRAVPFRTRDTVAAETPGRRTHVADRDPRRPARPVLHEPSPRSENACTAWPRTITQGNPSHRRTSETAFRPPLARPHTPELRSFGKRLPNPPEVVHVLAARSVLSSFPVTAFDAAGDLALGPYREHLRHQIDAGPAAIFACCGTGEFFSLTLDEYAAAVRAAVAEAAGALPVFAGTGYGTAMASQFAAAAKRSRRRRAARPPAVPDQALAARSARPLPRPGQEGGTAADRVPAGQRDLHPGDRGAARPDPRA